MDGGNVRRSFPWPRDGVRCLPMLIEEDDADVDLGIDDVVHLHSGKAEDRLIGPVERELDPFSQPADKLPQLREVTSQARTVRFGPAGRMVAVLNHSRWKMPPSRGEGRC